MLILHERSGPCSVSEFCHDEQNHSVSPFTITHKYVHHLVKSNVHHGCPRGILFTQRWTSRPLSLCTEMMITVAFLIDQVSEEARETDQSSVSANTDNVPPFQKGGSHYLGSQDPDFNSVAQQMGNETSMITLLFQ